MRILGIILAFVMLIVLLTWLKNEGPDLFDSNLRTIFQFPSSSYSTSWATTSTTANEPRYITTWRNEGTTGGAKNADVVNGNTGSQQGSGVSPYRNAVTVESVVIGSYSAVVLRHQGTAPISLSGWRIQSASGIVAIPAGVRKGAAAFGAAEPIMLTPGESIAIFEGVRDDRAAVLAPHAAWYAWTGSPFLSTRGIITVRDEGGREVTQYVY